MTTPSQKFHGSAESPFAPSKGLSTSTTEREEFLAALDSCPPPAEEPGQDPPPAGRARPRRMKQLQRGMVKPAATLDLHRLTRDEALARARTFLQGAVRQQLPAVLIVTGKGLHSQGGPVIRTTIERLLADCPELVVEWGTAPRQYGGGGALVVFLKQARG